MIPDSILSILSKLYFLSKIGYIIINTNLVSWMSDIFFIVITKTISTLVSEIRISVSLINNGSFEQG